MGDSASGFVASSIVTESFTFDASGGPLSAEITTLSVTGTFNLEFSDGSDASLSIAELGFSATGTVIGSGVQIPLLLVPWELMPIIR